MPPLGEQGLRPLNHSSAIDGMTYRQLSVGDYRFQVALCGHGEPLLLLHGFPQTHRIWRRVAAHLADQFTLIMPDLPGYGESGGPLPSADSAAYSKRAVAAALREMMALLGHEQFFLAGHDRGARIAYRMALDTPAAVRQLALLDIVPTLEAWEAMTAGSALASHHWLFLAAPAPVPENLISADPDTYIGHLLDQWAGNPAALDANDRRAYIDQYRKKSVVAASCADYRAGATLDWAHDAVDRDRGNRIKCPTLVLWGTEYLGKMKESPAQVWRRWCEHLEVHELPCGHFLAEEAPAQCAQLMRSFFKDAD